MTTARYSPRGTPAPLDRYRELLGGAARYDRIAGYFRSSLLELVHEELAGIDQVRIICNSDLSPRDVAVARRAADRDAAILRKWNEDGDALATALDRERYRRLYEFLVAGNVQVKVVPRDVTFLHGKAGVVYGRDGSATSFLGSGNATREAWTTHYELMWEDGTEAAVAWVAAEFDYLWNLGVDLPDVVVAEVARRAKRREYGSKKEVPEDEIGPATMAESPLYRGGERLMPWQRAFVTQFFEHRSRFGKARLLLADEVGLGKTLSLATSAVLSALLGDGPVLILSPATLTQQWQTELWDKLGVPSAVWTSKKRWMDQSGHEIRTRGAEDVVRCPYRIGIVSTGLLFRSHSVEREALLRKRYGTVILDEAHRARRGSRLGARGEPNNLLRFMVEIARRAQHVLLGTATPIQTDVTELWDLLDVLNQEAEHVLGRQPGSLWADPANSLSYVTGQEVPMEEPAAWALIRNPLPPRTEDSLFDLVRSDLEVADDRHVVTASYLALQELTREELVDRARERIRDVSFWQLHNPIVRHTILRRRSALEDKQLLPRIAVDIHPTEGLPKPFFEGQALRTNSAIDAAHAAALDFVGLLGQRVRSAGFLKSLILQRICSSVASGLSTARRLLEAGDLAEEDEVEADTDQGELHPLTEDERAALRDLVRALEGEVSDPKLTAVVHYLVEEPRWLERYGCIVFSQYYDTAEWVAGQLGRLLPDEGVALYAGADRSRFYLGGMVTDVAREEIKKAVQAGRVRLVIATDAACEGLNLQTLGTLINIDLPWNPSRLEQRIGRIKRIGQVRKEVDMLNLVYGGTRDEDVYRRLSRRLRDRFDLFGSLPDVIEDDWIDEIEDLDERLAQYIERRQRATAFDLRYSDSYESSDEPWEHCAEVLSRRNVIEALSEGW